VINAAIELLALLVYGPILVLMHEAGHAAFAGWGGYRVTSFGVGLGRPVWRMRLAGGVIVHVDRWFLAGGACIAIPTGPPTTRRAWFHAGGLLVQLGLAMVLLLLPETWLFTRIAHFNILVAITNAVPWKFRGSVSDGWYLMDAMLGGRRGGELLAQRGVLEALAARESAIDSPVGQVYADVCLAWIDVLTNRSGEAAYFFSGDPPESAVDPWLDVLYHYVYAEWHRMEGRPLAALRTIRQTRSAYSGQLADEAMDMLTVAEARCLLDLESPEQAQRALARLTGASGPIGRQAAAINLAAVLDSRSDGDELEFATWRVVRQAEEPFLDPPDVAMILWDAADSLEAQRRINAARGARDAARGLAQHSIGIASPEDRVQLLRRIGEPAGYSPPGAAATKG